MLFLRTLGLAAALPLTWAMQVDPSSYDSLKQAAFVVSHGMTKYYSGNESGEAPGYLPNSGAKDGYYWWEGAGFFGSLIDYWYYSGDSTFNDITLQAMTWQMGSDRNYEPQNSSQTLGNDDIGYWAMSALKAAELKFVNSPDPRSQWIPVVQRVFQRMIDRWDTKTCGGGLHWQTFVLSDGYHLKTSVAQGCLFNIAARLAKYTGDQIYFDWATKVYDWTAAVKMINPTVAFVEDNVDSDQNCSVVAGNPWTYNQGIFLYGAAVMLNATGNDALWRPRVDKLLADTQTTFVRKGVVTEIGCEDTETCNNNQKSFKSYLMMWLAETAKVAPHTAATIMPILTATAVAAGTACSGGDDGVSCGVTWNAGKYDGITGIGQQMNALQAFNAAMSPWKAGPVKSFKDGATSVIDPSGGVEPADGPDVLAPITAADRAGAGIVTFILVSATLGVALWMTTDDLVGSVKSVVFRKPYRMV